MWIREGVPDKLATVPLRHGLMRLERLFPGMALDPVPPVPSPAPGVDVHRVVDAADLADYREILVAGGATPDVVARLLPASLLADARFGLFAAALDARPAGTALTVRTGTTVGVCNVNVLAWARRRGVGTAVTGAAIADGRAAGCELAVL